MEVKYILYQTTNKLNGHIYIGVHKTNKPYEFDGYLGDGSYLNKPSSYNKGKTHFHNALKKYGPHNFIRTTLAVYDTELEALYHEESIVNENFLARNDVYNMIKGGGPISSFSIKVYRYDEQGNFIKEYNSFNDAAYDLDCNRSCISEAVVHKIRIKNSFWNTDKVDKLDLTNYRTNKIESKEISVYKITGEYVNTFDSTSKAAKYCNCSSSSAARSAVCGYAVDTKWYFSYIKETSYDIARTIYLRIRPVYKYNPDGSFNKSYQTQAEAELENPKSDITNCIKRKKTDKLGFMWSIEKLENFNCPKKNSPKRVGMFDDSGNLIKEWKSLTQCMKEFGKGVQHCLYRGQEKHKGMIFKYII